MGTHYRGTRRNARALDTFIKLARASNSVSARLNRALAHDAGITETQLGVLEALHHLGPLSQAHLATKLLTSASNLTTVVHNLEHAGLIRRERAEDDGRVLMVQLTAAGRRLIRRIFPVHARRIAHAMDALTVAEQRQLARLCRKLGLAQNA